MTETVHTGTGARVARLALAPRGGRRRAGWPCAHAHAHTERYTRSSIGAHACTLTYTRTHTDRRAGRHHQRSGGSASGSPGCERRSKTLSSPITDAGVGNCALTSSRWSACSTCHVLVSISLVSVQCSDMQTCSIAHLAYMSSRRTQSGRLRLPVAHTDQNSDVGDIRMVADDSGQSPQSDVRHSQSIV